MVRAFEVLCPFFNIRSNVPMFLYFFEMKLTGKIGWVLLSSVSKKMFEFKSNVFHIFKDCFFKVKATSVIADKFPLMHDWNMEPRFPFY